MYKIFKNLINKKFADEDMAEKRMSICIKCNEYAKSVKLCAVCGCVMPIKVKLPEVSCPINKW